MDNLKVSISDESEDVDYGKLKSAQIFNQLSVNYNDMNSDIDLGDKNVADGNQWLGCAALEVKLTNA